MASGYRAGGIAAPRRIRGSKVTHTPQRVSGSTVQRLCLWKVEATSAKEESTCKIAYRGLRNKRPVCVNSTLPMPRVGQKPPLSSNFISTYAVARPVARNQSQHHPRHPGVRWWKTHDSDLSAWSPRCSSDGDYFLLYTSGMFDFASRDEIRRGPVQTHFEAARRHGAKIELGAL